MGRREFRLCGSWLGGGAAAPLWSDALLLASTRLGACPSHCQACPQRNSTAPGGTQEGCLGDVQRVVWGLRGASLNAHDRHWTAWYRASRTSTVLQLLYNLFVKLDKLFTLCVTGSELCVQRCYNFLQLCDKSVTTVQYWCHNLLTTCYDKYYYWLQCVATSYIFVYNVLTPRLQFISKFVYNCVSNWYACLYKVSQLVDYLFTMWWQLIYNVITTLLQLVYDSS